MHALVLSDELAQAFVGALYAVCRADGEVCEAEVDALRAIAAELGIAALDDQTLFFSDVTPGALADAARGGDGGPFRAAAVSPPSAIRAAFVAAAERVARADGDYNEVEVRAVDHFARALSLIVR